jgi:hypothetical protein
VSGSRIALAKARAASAKAVLVVSALLAFLAALLLAAWTRPASTRSAQAVTPVVTSQTNSDDGSFFGSSDDQFSQGSIAPAQSTPQVTAGSS